MSEYISETNNDLIDIMGPMGGIGPGSVYPFLEREKGLGSWCLTMNGAISQDRATGPAAGFVYSRRRVFAAFDDL